MVGFLELRRQCGVSHEVRQGAQGASLMSPGKSGLHVCGERVRVISIEPWKQIQASSWVGPGKSNLQFELRGRAEDCARVTAGKKRPHLGLCLGPNVPLQGRQGSRGCIPDPPGESDLVSRGSKGLNSPLESRRVSLGAH